MRLDLQKVLASKVTGAGKRRIKIDFKDREKVKEAITKADIRDLIEDGLIKIDQKSGVSRAKARARATAKKRGRQRGPAKKVGRQTARNKPKRVWINRIRLQRKLLKTFKESGRLDSKNWKILYLRAKGGFFRNKRHLLQYLEQNKLLKEVKK
tara:strand:- start:1212 stop:1670 length:459 start_codon:yes stop_codon:yes gene_type:complete